MCVTNAVQFQLAHVCELLGQVPQARSKYEVLLGCRTVTSNIKALSQKQLGMCVCVGVCLSYSAWYNKQTRTPKTQHNTTHAHCTGWLLHRCTEMSSKEEEKGVRERALELLKQAAQAMPECGETWYLLGRQAPLIIPNSLKHLSLFRNRVLVNHQKFHEAFAAYQKTIRYPSKISRADVWHSIGSEHTRAHSRTQSLTHTHTHTHTGTCISR